MTADETDGSNSKRADQNGESDADNEVTAEIDPGIDDREDSASETVDETLFDEISIDAAIDEELAEIIAEDVVDPVVRERDEYLDTLRRLQAEFDNYRKRMIRQQTESVERATESLVERLLPTLDALDLALAHSASEESSPDRQALTQIASLLRDTMGKEGLERIDAIEVQFDPNIHDAVMHLEREEGEQSTGVVVTEVMRAGYQLKGKVVRPAMVQVRG
jgi:molecular chaperone GrpE